jgi:hypothetical protein
MLRNSCSVSNRILETVRTGRALVGTAGENGQGAAFEQNLAHGIVIRQLCATLREGW